MAKFLENELVLDAHYDAKRSRHYLNGHLSVLHCHHYLTLYTQLAEDVEFVDGRKLLADVAEDSFYRVLKDYFANHNLTELHKRVAIAEQYFGAMGLGQMKVKFVGHESGEVELLHSHLDEGWVKKWGETDKPINHVGRGYIAAMFALLNEMPRGSYVVNEVQSLAQGADVSIFNVVMK